MAGLIVDAQLYRVLKEIDLLPQLYERYLASHERVAIALPERNYSRSLSFHLFKVISEFYSGFLRHTPPVRSCSFCLQCHDRNYLCLPDYFQESSIELLAAMLTWQHVAYVSPIDLVSFVRLCGYLMIKTEFVHAFLSRLLPLYPYAVDSSGGARILAYELHSNGFFRTAKYFSRFVDHACCYRLPPQYPSYRSVKRKLRSVHRYRNLAKPYPSLSASSTSMITD